ncbi:energy-coupling factor transporter transmembrane protein EcfT [Vibrio sp.]|nr:energy-coupling factor transporter transmembrane protein EcfT [Vibrio sp.]
MLVSTYINKDSVIHRINPTIKLLALIVSSSLIMLFDNWGVLSAFFVGVCVLCLLGKIDLSTMCSAVKPAFWAIVLIFIAQLALNDYLVAIYTTARLILLLLLASIITLTTTTSQMMTAIESSLGFLPSKYDQNVKQFSLAVSLALRFIPRVRDIFIEVQQAQKARGMNNNWKALSTATIIRVLKLADDISDAISARSVKVRSNRMPTNEEQ